MIFMTLMFQRGLTGIGSNAHAAYGVDYGFTAGHCITRLVVAVIMMFVIVVIVIMNVAGHWIAS